MFVCLIRVLAEVTKTGNISSWWYFAFWGMLGGFVADGLRYSRVLCSAERETLEKYLSFAYFLGTFIRLSIGGILAAAFGLSGQISGEMGALVIGITAPAIIDKIIKESSNITSKVLEKASDT